MPDCNKCSPGRDGWCVATEDRVDGGTITTNRCRPFRTYEDLGLYLLAPDTVGVSFPPKADDGYSIDDIKAGVARYPSFRLSVAKDGTVEIVRTNKGLLHP